MALYPILEFDPDPRAILNPHWSSRNQPLPTRAVACFFQDVLHGLVAEGSLTQIGALESEIGPNPLYQLEWNKQQFLVFHPGVGAPLAAAFLEEAISGGARQIIACGGCGVLQADIVAGHPVVLTGAVRDEGTSYHYLPPARVVTAGPSATAALERALGARNLAYLCGKSWTTDAFYRETSSKRSHRIAEGCQVVEMEAAAFFAVAQFRGVEFGQIVYGGDLVVPEGWDKRDWGNRKDARSLLFWLAVEARFYDSTFHRVRAKHSEADLSCTRICSPNASPLHTPFLKKYHGKTDRHRWQHRKRQNHPGKASVPAPAARRLPGAAPRTSLPGNLQPGS